MATAINPTPALLGTRQRLRFSQRLWVQSLLELLQLEVSSVLPIPGGNEVISNAD